MRADKVVYLIQNQIQNYDWGTTDAIPSLLGIENSDKKPCAELWMGAHDKAPSTTIINGIEVKLNDLIASDPTFYLGNKVADQFGKLPYLFKVLSAGSALSIQVHPNKAQAEAGFADENAKGIELSAFNRNYKDDNHKPEIICALTPFWAMRGFRYTRKIYLLALSSFSPRLKELAKVLKDKSLSEADQLKGFFLSLLKLSEEDKKALLDEVLKKTAIRSKYQAVWKWVHQLAEKYPGDVGALAPLYLNLIHLQPGQALYLGAGVLHAYLQGTGMELMANSDNVLRGGLTPKYMDNDELVKVVKFFSETPEIISPLRVGCQLRYETPSNEFELSKVEVAGPSAIAGVISPSIFICLKGSVRMGSVQISQGQSLFVPYKADGLELDGNGTLYRATVPV